MAAPQPSTGIRQSRLESSKEDHYRAFGFSYLYAARREDAKEETGRFTKAEKKYTTEDSKLEKETYLKRSKVTRSQTLAKAEQWMAQKLDGAHTRVTAPMHKYFPRARGSNFGDTAPVKDLLTPEKAIANDYGAELGAVERGLPSVPGIGGDSPQGLGVQLVGNLTTPMDAALGASSLVKMNNQLDQALDDSLHYRKDALRFFWHLDKATVQEAEAFLKFLDACQRVLPPEAPSAGIRAVRFANWTADNGVKFNAVKSLFAAPPNSLGSTITVIASLSMGLNALPAGDLFAVPFGVATAAFDGVQGNTEYFQQRDKQKVAEIREKILSQISAMSLLLGGASTSLRAHQARLMKQATREGGVAVARMVKGAVHAPLSIAGGAVALAFVLGATSIASVGGVFLGLGIVGIAFGAAVAVRNQKRVRAEHTRKWRQRAAQTLMCHIPAQVLHGYMKSGTAAPFSVLFEEGEYLPGELRFKTPRLMDIDVLENEYIGLYAYATFVRDLLVCPRPDTPPDLQIELVNVLACLGISELEQEAICLAAQARSGNAQIDFIQARLAPAFGIKFTHTQGRTRAMHPSIFLNAFKEALIVCGDERWSSEWELPLALQKEKTAAEKWSRNLLAEQAEKLHAEKRPLNAPNTRWEDLQMDRELRIRKTLEELSSSKQHPDKKIERYLSLKFEGPMDWKEEFARSVEDFLMKTRVSVIAEPDHAALCSLLRKFLGYLKTSDGAPEEAENMSATDASEAPVELEDSWRQSRLEARRGGMLPRLLPLPLPLGESTPGMASPKSPSMAPGRQAKSPRAPTPKVPIDSPRGLSPSDLPRPRGPARLKKIERSTSLPRPSQSGRTSSDQMPLQSARLVSSPPARQTETPGVPMPQASIASASMLPTSDIESSPMSRRTSVQGKTALRRPLKDAARSPSPISFRPAASPSPLRTKEHEVVESMVTDVDDFFADNLFDQEDFENAASHSDNENERADDLNALDKGNHSNAYSDSDSTDEKSSKSQ